MKTPKQFLFAYTTSLQNTLKKHGLEKNYHRHTFTKILPEEI